MPYAVVTVEIRPGQRADLALPLDVPSQSLAAAMMDGLGEEQAALSRYSLHVRTEQGLTRIAPGETLGEAGVLDGYILQVKREEGPPPVDVPIPQGAYLRSEAGQPIALDTDRMVIGRKDIKHGNLVEIDLTSYDTGKVISRRHACITREGGRYYLADLRSTNGTKLNGKPVTAGQKMLLADGDLIEFGRNGVRVTFVGI